MEPPPSLKLPPILSRLQDPSLAYNKIGGSSRQVAQPRHKFPPLAPTLLPKQLSAPSIHHTSRNRKLGKPSIDSSPQTSARKGGDVKVADPSNFDDVFAAARRAAALKKMALRWSPEAVCSRMEAMKQEQRRLEEASTVRHQRRKVARLPPLARPSSQVEIRSEVSASPTAGLERRSSVDSVVSSAQTSPYSKVSFVHDVGQAKVAGAQSSATVERRRNSQVQVGVQSLPGGEKRRNSKLQVSVQGSPKHALRRSSNLLLHVHKGERRMGSLPPKSHAQEEQMDTSEHTISGPNVSLGMLNKRFGRFWTELDDTFGYTATEAIPLFNAYTRCLDEGDTELHKDELPRVATILGHLLDDKSAAASLADEITECSTLSFEEFLRWERKYAEHEQESWERAFVKYDLDHSGEICIDELAAVLNDLGCTAVRQVLREALQVVDVDGSGQIDINEFKQLMVNYRATEGFTKQEYVELENLFRRFDANSDGELDPHEQTRLKKYLGLKGSELGDGSDVVRVNSLPIPWRGFLAEVRRCREHEIQGFRELFTKYDTNGVGQLNISQLPSLLRDLGFTPLKRRLQECIQQVDEDGSGAVDFEEFVHMMWLYRRSEGFTAEEVVELQAVFAKFDTDRSGEISTLELGNILRDQGHAPNLDELQRLCVEYDVDGNGEIGLREFLKVMRSFREAEFRQYLQMFNRHDADKSGTMSTQEFAGVLKELGHPVSYAIVTEVIASVDVDGTGQVDLEGFVELMDRYRRLEANERRRRCGFTDAKLNSIREAFDTYDVDGSDDISSSELVHVLKDLNLEPRTEAEQQHVLAMLEQCRELAGETAGKTTFWVFLRLLRMLEDDKDRSSLAVERQAAEKANFSKEEVGEFRDIFATWYDKLSKLGEGCGASKHTRALTAEGITRILRSLGLSLPGKADHDELEAILRECDQDGNGQVDFPDFLVLMRRLMDDNFRNINEVTGERTAT